MTALHLIYPYFNLANIGRITGNDDHMRIKQGLNDYVLGQITYYYIYVTDGFP